MFYLCVVLPVLGIIFYLLAKYIEKKYNEKQVDDYIALYCIFIFLTLVCLVGFFVCIFIFVNSLLS